jgi:hypothetical protein
MNLPTTVPAAIWVASILLIIGSIMINDRACVPIVLSLTALVGSGVIAQTTSNKADKQTTAEYREKAPYRPCPTVASINGRNVCLGCPGRCPWPPSFGK